MSRYTLIALPFLLLVAVLLPACGQQSDAPAQASPTETSAEPAEQAASDADTEIKEAGNTVCPITGSKVGSMEEGAHMDYQGYRVGLCCNACKETFLAAPDENIKKALGKKE